MFAVIGLSAALPAVDPKDAEATVVAGSEKVAEYFNPEGYDYQFKTSNHIEKQEKSELDKGLVTGEYSYVNPEDKYFFYFAVHSNKNESERRRDQSRIKMPKGIRLRI